MNKIKLLLGIILFSIVSIGGISLFYYNSQLKPVSSTEIFYEFEVNEGQTINQILNNLETAGLIKNDLVSKIHVKLKGYSNVKAGTYLFSPTYSTDEILSKMIEGSDYFPDQIEITFVEGLNIKQISEVISQETNHTYDDVFNKLNDQTFISGLIDKYWFLTDDILRVGIYYPLEGYLTPNTYIFSSKDAPLDEIIYKILNQTDSELSQYKDNFESENISSIHELLTLASIVELEAVSYEDRRGVATVFNNRLTNGISLGSDVTVYYGVGVLMNERDLTHADLNDINLYNTRNYVVGLPVGPVGNPSVDSIDATVNLLQENYLFFVSDKYRNIHFTYTLLEHLQLIDDLKRDGLWYEW